MTFLGEERWGVIGLGSSARKIPSRLPSESAFGLHLPRQTPDSSDLRRRLGSAELALAGSVPAGGGWDRPYALSGYGGGPNRCLVKVPGSTPGKIPNPSSNLGKMTKWVVRYEEDAYDPTAVWRIATAANHKADMVQQQRGGFQKVVTGLKESMNRVENLLQRLANLQDGGAINLRPIDESRNVSVLIQPREMARRVDDLRQINPNSTQGVQLKSTPEGNSKLLSTGLSVVAIGWDQDPLPCSRASSTVNHQNPSQEPALDRQWLQNPKENLSQSHPQYQAKQWDSNPSNKRDLSVSTVDDDLSYSNNMKIEQMEQTKVKAKLCSVEYQHRWVPGKEILEQEVYGIDPYTHNLPKETVPADLDWSIDDKAEEKKGVNESGDEDKINKDIAVKTNFVMANVPDEAKFYLTQLYMVGRDDRWLWSTRLLWKPPPWPDFCAMGCDSVAQQGGYEVLVNFHSVKKYHISLDKAFELNDYCYSHQPPISLIKAEVGGLFGSVFCDFGPEITVLDVDGGDPHTGITASISNDNPALVSCDDDEADFHMRQGALLYNFDAQMLPKGYHCVSRRLMLEYSKFSSLDSDEPFAGKLNNPKHRNTYKLVYVHVLNYEAILWEKLPKFSMQQLYFVGLLWNLPPWPDLNFCEVNWMANGMDKGAGAVLKKDVYNTVTGQSKIYSQLAKSKPFIVAGVENEIVSASSGTPSTDLIVCAVCRRSTSFRCKRCKGVKYCTFKCKIAHWRQGHKDECHSPSVDAGPDHITEASSVKKGVEWNSSCEENVLARVEPAVKINKSVAAMPESSEEDCVVESLDGESKEMPFEKASNTAEASEDDHDNSRIKFSQLPGQAESVNCSMLPTSGTACKVHGAVVGENVSHIPEHNYNSQDDWSAQLESQLEKPNKQAGTDNLKSSRCLPSMSAVDEVSSKRGGAYSAARNPSKRADNLSEISVRSENEGAVPYNLSTAKKAIRQQTAPKLVRNYPLELTLFPYELFVKLYNFDKVELHPFGPCSLGNTCYANAVLQCLAFTRPLTAYLLEGLHSRNCSKKEWCFLSEFEKLIAEGKRGKSPLSPTGILPHLRDIGSSFGPGREEDAHEFLRYAIDTMQSASMKEAKKNGDNQLAEETTLVKLIFGGYLRSKIKGTKCQVSSEQCERILDLTVEIDGDISTLEEALHWFTSTEILDGDNRYPCSRCKSYERAKKKLTISEAPNILTIALKRYQSGKLGKINKAIRFPEYLYLSSYMSTTDDRSPVYRLYAVVVPHDVINAVTEAIEETRVALGAAVILNYCLQAFSIQPGTYVKYIGRSTTHYILEHEMHLLLLILY